MPRVFFPAFASIVFSCSPSAKTSSVPTDTGEPFGTETPIECESIYGTINGTVISDIEWFQFGEAMPHATVSATPVDDPEQRISILADEHGTFEADLPAGEYTMQGQTSGCISERSTLSLAACETKTHRIGLVDCLEGG